MYFFINVAFVVCGITLGETSANCVLTQWEQHILDSHNIWRSSVMPHALDMHRLRWDENIALNARTWVASCDPNWPHSSESFRSNVGGYAKLGENLEYCGGPACPPASTINVTDGSGLGQYGLSWWNEKDQYNWASNTGSFVAHYKMLASSNTIAIGCHQQQCSAPGPSGWMGDWSWTICQYGERGRGYWSNTRPFEEDTGASSTVLIDPPAYAYTNHTGLCQTGTANPTSSPTTTAPTAASASPTKSPSLSPTTAPTTVMPSSTATPTTVTPTREPSAAPTVSLGSPTTAPTTRAPTLSSTKNPTSSPSMPTTNGPTTSNPSVAPTLSPPTLAPTPSTAARGILLLTLLIVPMLVTFL